jgi:hemerythrin-like domain-containing protein
MTAPTAWINAGVQIPDLLRTAPQVRPVLDRYGLRGCGGPLGPAESLGFFAQAHEIPVDQLLLEVRASLDRPPEPPAEPQAADRAVQLADTVYRPFFKAGIVVVLTLGASWGAYLLWQIGFSGRGFQAAGVHEVNAHGHAQIFGWVGLFVMGFAYQAFPRFKHTTLAHPRWAHASLWLLAAGLVARSVLQPLAPTNAWLFGPALAASALEVAAIALFVWIVLATWRGSGKTLAFYDYYILSGLVWFLVQAVYEAVYLAATLSATGPELVALVATWQIPLRDIQIHGFALLMILGVSQRLFHHMYGLPAPDPRRGVRALACLNAAVAGEAAGWVLLRLEGPAWAGLWYGSVLLLTGAVVWLVAGWHLFSPAKEPDRSLKFLRAAYAWLFLSLGMLVLWPAYQYGLLALLAPDSTAAQHHFSHAYYGAIRHAITVGFVSLMIVGVAAKVVPTLNGVDVRSLRPLWVPFLLINTGCAARVLGQTLTDFTDASFPFAGVSGLLEVTGLALWGFHLWSIMAGRPASLLSNAGPADSAPLAVGAAIEPDNLVGDVLALYPELLPTFRAFGFRAVANPILRRTLARYVSLRRACQLLEVDLDQFVNALNTARERLNPHSTPKGEMSMQPTEILSTEHRVIEQVLACLEVLADRCTADGVLDRQAAGQALDFFRTFADGCHHGKEEDHLFPLLEARGLPREGGPTGVMRWEHELGRRHLRVMAEAVDAADISRFADHARAYANLLREHIAKEDERLFPMADRFLTAEDRQELLDRFADVEGRKMHAGTHEKYLQLANDLADRLGVPRAPVVGTAKGGCSCDCHASRH